MSKKFFDDDDFPEMVHLPPEEGSEEFGGQDEADQYEDESEEQVGFEGEDGRSLEEHEEPAMDDSTILSNARLRLEQGRLYEMLMKHSFFGEIDADPRAVQNIESEMRSFIKERMEIMLGMRTESSRDTEHFTAEEIQILKTVVGSAKVRSAAPVATSRPLVQAPRPVAPQRPAPSPLRKLGGPVAPRPAPRAPVSPARRPNVPLPPKKSKVVHEQDEAPIGKSAWEMSSEELLARNERIKKRQAQRQVVPDNRIPMPDVNQENNLYATQVATSGGRIETSGQSLFNYLQKTGQMIGD